MAQTADKGKSGAGDALDATVLVVDDEPVVRKLVVKSLKRWGYERVLEAEDGHAAQRLLGEYRVDLVITDVSMPGLTGIELMQWATEQGRSPVWIILSGLDQFDVAVDAIRHGAFDFVAKPFQLAQLEVSVRNGLERRRLLLERRRLHEELHASNERLRQNVQDLEGACRTLQEQREIIRRDLRRAETIQRSLLPPAARLSGGLRYDAFYRPGRHVGGDLYDVCRVDDRHLALYVSDASGHGVTAAMLSVLFKQRLRVALEDRVARPAEVLEQVNRALLRDIASPGLFLTAAYCLVDTAEQNVLLASAGHPPAVLRRASGDAIYLEPTGPALGLSGDARFAQHQFHLDPEDRLLLYTDGLLDGTPEDALTRSRIAQALASPGAAGRDTLDRLFDAATAAACDDDRDDVTMVLLEAREGASTFDHGDRAEAAATGAPGAGAEANVFYGETEDATVLSVRGRGTWLQCDAFAESGKDCVQARRPVVLDLTDCEYLDSTFLGTIHEIVGLAAAAGVGVRLQGVRPEVRRLFEELHMDQVLAAVGEDHLALPADMKPLHLPGLEPRARQLQILRAHELLACLGDDNHEQFDALVASLRAELKAEA